MLTITFGSTQKLRAKSSSLLISISQTIKDLTAKCALRFLQFNWIDRIAGFLVYQRRRHLRHQLENRLHASGVYGDQVLQGPFEGMRYPPLNHWASHRFEKIIGAYEHELHGLLQRLAASKEYRTIVNVGAAEGFYTSGLAILFPQASVISFETNQNLAAFCGHLCEINAVAPRVKQRAHCNLEELASLNPENPNLALVFMDVETSERVLLDPAKVPWLTHADILVELHESMEPGLVQLIRTRFAPTHHIEQFTSSGLDYARYPLLRDLRFIEIEALVGEERRGLQDWFFMQPLEPLGGGKS